MKFTLLLWISSIALIYGQAPSESSVDSMMNLAMAANASPGMAVAVVSGDKIVYAKGFGVTDIHSRIPAEKDTPFYIASTTKSLTAMAALIGAMQKKWDLDAPVAPYLKELPDSLDAAHLTLRQLLCHAHGITGDEPLTLRTAYSGDIDEKSMQRAIMALRPSPAGKIFQYSNTGYILAGLVMERITGMSWKEIVSETVLKPAGMNSTWSGVKGLDAQKFAQPHVLDSAGFRMLPYAKTDITMHAAGGHISTAPDLARWLLLHLNEGMIDGKQALPKEAIAESHILQVPQDRKFGAIRRFGWSPGWDIGILNGDTIYHRFGSYSGFRSHVSFMPARRLGVVVLVNEPGAGGQLADLTAAYLYDAYSTKPADQYQKQFTEFAAQVKAGRAKSAEEMRKRAARAQPLPRPLESYTGSFTNDAAGTIEFIISGGKLVCAMGVAVDHPEIYNAAADQWRTELAGRGQIITFKFDSDTARAIEFDGMIYNRNN